MIENLFLVGDFILIDIPVPYRENLHSIFDLLNRKMVEVRAGQPDIMGPTVGLKLIARDSNGSIAKPEWLRLMRDVFLSRKLNDASAVVFGPGCCDN